MIVAFLGIFLMIKEGLLYYGNILAFVCAITFLDLMMIEFFLPVNIISGILVVFFKASRLY